MEPLARITLLKPYRDDPNLVITLRFGQRALAHVGAPSIMDPSTHVGWNGDQPNNSFQAAEWIEFPLGWPEHVRTVTVPAGCAKLWFGNWDVKADSPPNALLEPFALERRRVAMKWGDWRRMPHAQQTPQGFRADPRIIGAPDIPHVSIVELDSNGNILSAPYVPWDIYHWERDVDKRAVAEAEQSRAKFGEAAQSAGDSLSSPAFAEAVQREVERQLLARGKKVS